jgi:hypothetical protein
MVPPSTITVVPVAEGVGSEEQIRWAPYARVGLAIDTGHRER